MPKIGLLIFILFAFGSILNAQEPVWLTKIKQIEPLKSTEKDVERIFGKPMERYEDLDKYKLEEGDITIYYSGGKCSANKDSEYDVEKGTVVGIGFYTPKFIDFKSLNISLVGFKKEYAGADGAYSYENKALGISYSLSKNWLEGISIDPAENYAYLACPKKPKEPEPVTDDVDQTTFVKLTQLKVLQNTRTDVEALFGKSFQSKGEQNDFYTGEGYALGFTYSTGKCSLLKEDIWNVSKGKIIGIVIIFSNYGISSTLDLGKLDKKKYEENGFSYYENKEEGVEYKIKDNRIWRIQYYPRKRYDELRCVRQ